MHFAFFGRLEVDGIATEVDQPVLRYREMINNVHLCLRAQSTYEGVVSAADGLGGARGTTSHTEDSDRATAEPDETRDVGKLDSEFTAELTERCGVRLEHTPWLAQRAKT